MATTKNFIIGALSTTAIALALTATPANAEIILSGGSDGWQFGFDGFVNVFGIDSNTKARSGGAAASTSGQTGAIMGTAGNQFTVGDGLMPETFGFNAHSPDINGNKINGRFSLEPSIGTGAYNNTSTSASNVMEVREAYASIGGAWGEFQGGKSLGIFGSQAIANDITLFGVGANAGSNGAPGNTTYGRIGYGYQYAAWNPNVRYTTPAWNGFKATGAIFSPTAIAYDQGTGTGSATGLRTPQLQGSVTWAGKAADAAISVWLNGMWQEASMVNSSSGGNIYNGNTYAKTNGQMVNVAGGELGGKVSYGPVDLVATGYWGNALSVTGVQMAHSATDANGQGENTYGGYVQAAYHFGQGTSVAASVGGNFADPTSIQQAAAGLSKNGANTVGGSGGGGGGAAYAATRTQESMYVVQVWHEVNKYFRVVAEYNNSAAYWNDSSAQRQQTGALGFVATW